MDTGTADEQLMLRYQQGEHRAFELLYTRHKGALYRYFLRHCGSAAAAEELFQDVWVNLIRSRERYQVRAKFTTYLYRMAHNRLVDHYRRHSRNPGVSFDDHSNPTIENFAAPDREQPEQRLVHNRTIDKLKQLIAALPPAQREAFLLREEGGLSLDEIAEVTDVGREAAKSRLRYAVARLRKGLVETG